MTNQEFLKNTIQAELSQTYPQNVNMDLHLEGKNLVCFTLHESVFEDTKILRKYGFILTEKNRWELFLDKDDQIENDKVIGKSALVIFSGGQDSTTCLYWAKQRFETVSAVHFDYKQRHSDAEFYSVMKNTKLSDINVKTLRLDIFAELEDSLLVKKEGNVSSSHRSRNDLPASFVPGKNLIFITTAAALAYKLGIKNLVTGVCENDIQGYPDCRAATMKALELSIQKGMDYPFKILTPLLHLSKKEIVEWSNEIAGCREGLAFSHNCYEGVFPPCGICPACKGREKGFNEAGYKDPLLVRATTM